MTRVFRILTIVLALITALYPLVEIFDRWDTSPLPSNDTELCVTCLLAGLGLIILLAQILPGIFRLFDAFLPALAVAARIKSHRQDSLRDLTPFLPSTIPLRI